MKNKKTTWKSTIKKIRNIFSDLDQQRQKESTVFQNETIDAVYYLFNPLGINNQLCRLMLPRLVKVNKKKIKWDTKYNFWS